jgi:hypothetical protein
MDCRERTLRAIRFERPDRIPVAYSITPGALFDHGRALLEVCRRYPNDFNDETTVRLPERDRGNWPTLRRLARGRLCLVPDFDRQGVFPFGTPAQVREHARAVRDTFTTPAARTRREDSGAPSLAHLSMQTWHFGQK